ncbi:hypothetical protein BC833DRAFT_606075 [Globomyces pollinis-pini]|nr:hypothetical protein BC833DRAFT_606075 [Globomyces pollinis-pini]
MPLITTTDPVTLHPHFAQSNWGTLWQQYQNENVYNCVDTFRWRKSQIRLAFLNSIQLVQKTISRSPSQTIPTETNQPQTQETLLLAAKKLCDLTEDDIKKKTKTELKEYISNVQNSLSSVQDQINYWLDGKEQLVMDAEMHNKMIASLVTYAQQQQNPVKKKKGR